MATTSQVKAGLDEIAKQIRESRELYDRMKARIVSQRDALDAIPGTYGAVLAEIEAYTGADAFETVSKAELARLTTEFVALRASIQNLVTSPAFTA